MRQPTRFVGLDVHSTTISVAVAEEGRDEPLFLTRLPNDRARLLKSLDRLGPRSSLHCAYEAGPTGYGLQRALTEAGIRCDVIAPSKMPRKSGDQVKTDRKDAVRLAHCLRAGDLVAVHVPDQACEAMRDLLRAREDARRAQLCARHQLSKFLLRHERRWAKSTWTKPHIEWIEQQRFEHAAQSRVLEEYLHSVNEATARIARYDALLAELVPSTEQAALIQALQAFRGIQLLTAASVAYELGDLRRFPTPSRLMGYLGVTPSEDSSGDRVRRGAITKAGNKGLRRLLVEAAWSYRHSPREAYRLRKRAQGVAPRVRAIAWKAQVRLNKRYRHMHARGKPKQKVLVAIARELAGFLWAAGQEETLLAK
jgi:transposase